MQSFDTDNEDEVPASQNSGNLEICRSEKLRPGSSFRFQLPDGAELALFNVNGEYYAIDNSCPHRGAPLSEGAVCGYVVECALHGWQFDLRSGECLTVTERLKTYEVREEEGVLKVSIAG